MPSYPRSREFFRTYNELDVAIAASGRFQCAGPSVRHELEIVPGHVFYATCVYTQIAYN